MIFQKRNFLGFLPPFFHFFLCSLLFFSSFASFFAAFYRVFFYIFFLFSSYLFSLLLSYFFFLQLLYLLNYRHLQYCRLETARLHDIVDDADVTANMLLELGGISCITCEYICKRVNCIMNLSFGESLNR